MSARETLDGPWLRIALALLDGPKTLAQVQAQFARRASKNALKNLEVMTLVGLVAVVGIPPNAVYALTSKGREQVPELP